MSHMISTSNQSEAQNRLRLYGQNERASSTSSHGTGPKWTSSISDMLMNRVTAARPTNAAQSHQTSQHQLLNQPQAPPATQSQMLPGSNKASADGGRLMMKLMNIGTAPHHQVTASNISAGTFDHARLSGSRGGEEQQKRLALDECTNYLQQKTMQ